MGLVLKSNLITPLKSNQITFLTTLFYKYLLISIGQKERKKKREECEDGRKRETKGKKMSNAGRSDKKGRWVKWVTKKKEKEGRDWK